MLSVWERRGSGAAVVAVALLIMSAGEVRGQDEAPALHHERFAFDAADTDGDGRISEAEFARDAAAGFTSLDADGDGYLTRDELDDHDPEAFDRVDADGDGRLSFSEVMNYKMDAFEAADVDGDGYLSFEEMVDAAAGEAGVQ